MSDSQPEDKIVQSDMAFWTVLTRFIDYFRLSIFGSMFRILPSQEYLDLKNIQFDAPEPPVWVRQPNRRRKVVRRNTAVLTAINPVDFDPRDRDHLMALYLMMVENRLHPEVRFKFNPAEFDNAYIACLFQLADHHIPKEIKDAACRLSDALTENAAERLVLIGDKAYPWEVATELQQQIRIDPETGGIQVPVELHPSDVL